jgi:hypothetical protein
MTYILRRKSMSKSSRWQKMFDVFKIERTRGELDAILKRVKTKTGAKHPAELIGREGELTPQQLEAVSRWLESLVDVRDTDEAPGPYYWEDRLRFSGEDDEDMDDETADEEMVTADQAAEPQPSPEVSSSTSFPEKYYVGDQTLYHTLGRIASFKAVANYCDGDWDDDVNLEPLQVLLHNMMSSDDGAETDNVFLLFLAGRSISTLRVKEASGHVEYSRDAGVDPNTVRTEHMNELLRRIDLDRIDPEIAEIISQRMT